MSRLMEREYFGEFTFLRQWNQTGRPEGVDIKNYPKGRFTININGTVRNIPEELGYWLHTIDYYKQPKKKSLGFGKTPIKCEKIDNYYTVNLEFPYYESTIKIYVKLVTDNRELNVEDIKACCEHTISCGEEFDWGDGKVTQEIFELAVKKKSRDIRKIAKRKFVADVNLSDGQGGEDHYRNFENRLFRILFEKKKDHDWELTLINRSLKIDLNTFECTTHPWVKNFKDGGIVKEVEITLTDKEGNCTNIYKNNKNIPNDL